MNKNIIIYIDAANIILSARDANFDLDPDLLFQHLYDKYRDCKIIFFIGDVKYLDTIRDIILKHKIELIIKQTVKEGGKIKANCDVELANRLTVDVERNSVESIILLSGDGDFVALTDYARKMKKEVRCISFAPENTSIFIKQREYLKVMYLIQIRDLVENKKALIKHAT
jgi:uncharacterized LabA/DUF88 family protein